MLPLVPDYRWDCQVGFVEIVEKIFLHESLYDLGIMVLNSITLHDLREGFLLFSRTILKRHIASLSVSG